MREEEEREIGERREGDKGGERRKERGGIQGKWKGDKEKGESRRGKGGCMNIQAE